MLGGLGELVEDDRRCNELELGPVCRARFDAVQHGGTLGIHRLERADGRRSYGPRGDVHGNAWADATRTRSARVGNWLDSARSPQAKCRVVKDPRLAKITTLETANVFLAREYWPHWNERFARPVNDFLNEHRTLNPALGTGLDSVSRRRARYRQRLQVFLNWSALLDRSRPS